MATIVQRMQGAARLHIPTYEEVEHDHTATGQAAAVVALAAVAQAIGYGGAIFAAVIAQLLAWAVWAGVTYFVGTRLFRGTAYWGELLRTLGFAQAPGILGALAILPLVGGIVRFAVWIWLGITGVIAVRQALDITTGKAVATVLISIIPAGIIIGLFARLFGL